MPEPTTAEKFLEHYEKYQSAKSRNNAYWTKLCAMWAIGELRELNKRRKIHQIAWVTRDLERSMKAWVDNLKVGPWTVLTFTEKTLAVLAARPCDCGLFAQGISLGSPAVSASSRSRL
jgi:uncharacterized HAD superfamily protein